MTTTREEIEQLNNTLAMLGFEQVSQRELELMETEKGADVEERWLNALLSGTEEAP